MAVVEIKRQMRVTARAWRKLWRRRLKPVTVLRLFARSARKVAHALSLMTLVIFGGAIVATFVLFMRLFFRLRSAARKS